MKYGTVAGIEKPISRLVQGAMMLLDDNRDAMFAAFDAIFDLGCRTFDTAHDYMDGDADRALGAWIQIRGLRDEVVILGKGAHPHGGQKRVKPEYITADLHDSLEWMGTDYIDLYILHRDDEDVPVGEIVDVLNENKNAGKISAFGGSNWTHERIAAANDYAVANDLTPFAASSVQFSLAEMVVPPWDGCISIGGGETEARAWYVESNMPVFNWSSLAGGFMTGHFRRDNLDSFTEYFATTTVKGYAYEANFQRLERAESLAAEKGVSLPQLALAYVLNQPLNLFPLVGCRSADEFAANVAALGVELSVDEMAWLETGVLQTRRSTH